MSNNTFYRQPKSTAQPEQNNFPELLDDSQWTLAATFSQDDTFSGPSDRIGKYYRQALNELDTEGLSRKRAERTAPASPNIAGGRRALQTSSGTLDGPPKGLKLG